MGMLGLSSTALAGVPTGQTLQATVSPSKQPKASFGAAKLRAIIHTTYSDFMASPPPMETLFKVDNQIRFFNGNTPACPQATLLGAITPEAVQAQCGRSVVGSGTAEVNASQFPFTAPNPVVLVSGGGTTLYVWVRIAGALTLVLTGNYAKGSNTLDFTGLPNTPGTNLTNFDISFNKKRTGGSTYYVMARCKRSKWLSSETTTFYDGRSLTASAEQKCKRGGGGTTSRGGGKKGKKKKKAPHRDGKYVGSTTQEAITPSFRKIRFTVKNGKVKLTSEPTVARGYCLSTPVFTLGGTIPTKKLSRRGAFSFTHTFLGNKFDKIHGKFVGVDEVRGYAIYHFFAQDLCSAGRAKVNFSAKHK